MIFKTVFRKTVFTYRLEDGQLSYMIEGDGARYETTVDLKQENLKVKQGRGVPFECKLAAYGCFLVTAVVTVMLMRDIRDQDQTGIIGCITAWVVVFPVCLYLLIKNRKKREYFLVQAKDGGGMYIYCEKPEDKQQYDQFIEAIKNEIGK